MKNIIENAFIEILSGIAQFDDGGVIIEDEYNNNNNKITICFPTKSPSQAVVKGYYKSGQLSWEEEYHQGKLHGKCLGYHENGQLHWDNEYHQGKLHGKCLKYYKNGQLHWEEEYHQGKPINEKHY